MRCEKSQRKLRWSLGDTGQVGWGVQGASAEAGRPGAGGRCCPVVVRGAHPGGGGGAAAGGGCVSLRCHPPQRRAGIRLELTAEDIQLDCACHSVASIRASPRAFVLAVRAAQGRPTERAPRLFVSFPFTSTSSSLSGPRLLHVERRPWKSFRMCIVRFVRSSDPNEAFGKMAERGIST